MKKDWKENKKLQDAKEKLENKKVRNILMWVFEITATLVIAAMVAIIMFQSVTDRKSVV